MNSRNLESKRITLILQSKISFSNKDTKVHKVQKKFKGLTSMSVADITENSDLSL